MNAALILRLLDFALLAAERGPAIAAAFEGVRAKLAAMGEREPTDAELEELGGLADARLAELDALAEAADDNG